ncbi:MAG TPA: hypothetical protein VNY74_12905 [Edaphobacter sp.]|nr:hypothetical protein [Edaphobacter sp.]
MVLGMSLGIYTTLHVIISLIAIGTGFIVLFGLISGRLLSPWNGVFLATTILTSLTGFAFPNTKVTPGIVLGILSMIVLASPCSPSTSSTSREDGAAPTPSAP